VYIVVGGFGTAGHERGAVARPIFTARDAHAKIKETFIGDLADAAFGVLVPLVTAVNDAVAGLEMVGECGDGLIDGGAGLDKDDNGSGTLDGQNEFTRIVLARERKRTLIAGPIYGLIDLRRCTVVDGDGEPLLRNV